MWELVVCLHKVVVHFAILHECAALWRICPRSFTTWYTFGIIEDMERACLLCGEYGEPPWGWCQFLIFLVFSFNVILFVSSPFLLFHVCLHVTIYWKIGKRWVRMRRTIKDQDRVLVYWESKLVVFSSPNDWTAVRASWDGFYIENHPQSRLRNLFIINMW